MKFKDVAYMLENVRKLVIYQNYEQQEIPVFNATTGESRNYFEYKVCKIVPKTLIDTTDNMVQIITIIAVYLEY